MKHWLLGLIVMAASASPACAMDGSTDFDWTGFYAGFSGGVDTGQEDGNGAIPSIGHVGALESEPASIALQAGYNQQVESFVFGLESDARLSALFNERDDGYFGNIRLRAGFAAGRLMVYGTGGIALADVGYANSYADMVDVSGHFADWGYTLGGGLEYAAGERASLKLEYLYTRLGGHQMSTRDVTLPGFSIKGMDTDSEPDFHTVRLGLNIHF